MNLTNFVNIFFKVALLILWIVILIIFLCELVKPSKIPIQFDIIYEDDMPIIMPRRITEPVRITSDSQNTHDSVVNRAIAANVQRLKVTHPEYADMTYGDILSRIKIYIDFEATRKFVIYEQVFAWMQAGEVMAFGINPMTALKLAWLRAEANPNNSHNIKEAILMAVEDKSHVCAHGMVVSCIGALDGTDEIGDLQIAITRNIKIRDVSEFVSVEIKKIVAEYEPRQIGQYYLNVLNNKQCDEPKFLDCEKSTIQKFVRDRLEVAILKKFGEQQLQNAKQFILGDIDFIFN